MPLSLRSAGSLVLALLCGSLVCAADIVLRVPAAPQPLALAVALPEDSLPAGLAVPGGARLVELGGVGAVVPAQLAPRAGADGRPTAYGEVLAVIPPCAAEGGARRFRLEAAEGESPPDGFEWVEATAATLRLNQGDRPVLAYHHGPIINDPAAPVGDPRRERACYIHPVWGLRGEILTEDFPKDHPHHHGVFWTWPHVHIEDQEYDLWVSNNIQQRHVAWLARAAGPVAAVLGVENGWFVGDRQVMIERVWLRAYRAGEADRTLDVMLTLIPVDRPVTLRGAPGKSYGGLTVRFAPPPGVPPVITVPAGPTTEDLPDTRLPWADFTTTFAGADAPSGAAVLAPQDHPDYPPTWLTRHYGPLCIGWPGVEGRTLPPDQPVRLDYRLWLHRDAAETATLAAVHEAYHEARGAEVEK